ncbi:hypothetical protein ACOSQ3_006946 [Xanthoceras sorbifolium]
MGPGAAAVEVDNSMDHFMLDSGALAAVTENSNIQVGSGGPGLVKMSVLSKPSPNSNMEVKGRTRWKQLARGVSKKGETDDTLNPFGVPYTQQSYKVSDVCPFKRINKKWKAGFSVTFMTTSGSKLGVVVSRNIGYSNQLNGYRITSTAATEDQTAFILSATKRKIQDVMQETLRTSYFLCIGTYELNYHNFLVFWGCITLQHVLL